MIDTLIGAEFEGKDVYKRQVIIEEFDEELFLIIIQQVTVYPAQRLGFRLKNGLELEETCGKAVE